MLNYLDAGSVGTSSVTTESRVEPDGSSVCPAPSPSQEVDVGPTTTQGSGAFPTRVRFRSFSTHSTFF